MSRILQLSVAADEFLLGSALSVVPDVEVELGRVAPVGRESDVVPFLWVDGCGREAFESAVDAADDVESYRRLADADGEWLYELDWADGENDLLDGIVRTDGSIVEGYGDSRRWRLRLRFPSDERLSAFSEFCNDRGVSITIERTYAETTRARPDAPLTDKQAETLTEAYAAGYFDVPREANLSDVADRLGVSPQSTSERLRRALTRVIADSYRTPSDCDPDEDG